MIRPFEYFALLLKASLFSTGGFGNFPSVHSDFLVRAWATERQFAESMMVGQLSPGPNGFWIISLGYLTDGLRGALLALLAISLPPLLVIGVDHLYHRVKDHPAVEGFVQGVGISVIGIFAVVLMGLFKSVGFNVQTLLIALGALGLGLIPRIPVVAIMALAALAGVILR